VNGQWFQVERLEGDVIVVRDPGYAQPSLIYIVEGTERVAVIDTGLGLADLAGLVATLTVREPVVLQTHAHPDHAGASHQFERVMAHPKAAAKLREGWRAMELRFDVQRYYSDRPLPGGIDPDTFEIPGTASVQEFENRGVVDLGGRQLDVFFTPGHSADSVCLLDLERGLLFTGDSVYAGRIAIADSRTYRRSIETLNRLASLATAVYPAHGETPIPPDFVRKVRRGFIDALSDRRPSGFLAGFATFEFDDFGLMLPPRRRRLQEE
jgi:glyoxylase-like metal-dependent hydrolase (beta-lactamase superfamily II)